MYYEWEQFAVSAVDATYEDVIHDVVIVGGGPVGLSLAVSLRNQGLDVIVLEARTQVSDGSRAITMNRESLGFFSRIGVADDYLKMAQLRQRSIVLHGHEELWRTEFFPEENERWPSLALLQQCWLEDILIGKLGDDAKGIIRWGHSVKDVAQQDDSATVQVDAGGYSYRIRARYVVGADGARGITRKSLNLEYQEIIPKRGADTNFVICDFTMNHPLESGRRMFIGPDYAPNSISLFHSQPFGVWRLDYEVPGELTAEEAATPEAAESRVRQHLAMMGIDADPEILWVTTYRAMGRTLDSYRHGRVLFVGDAAHQSPIFGGRGLNMGFGDVNALAWRLPLALAGDSIELDRYSEERTFVVRRMLQALTPVCLFMTSADEQSRLLRRGVMDLLPEIPQLKELVDGHAAAQVSEFPLDNENSGGVGRPLRELVVTTDSQKSKYLSELLPKGHFSITILPDLTGSENTVYLQLLGMEAISDDEEQTDEPESHVVLAPRDSVSERLGLNAVGDVLYGRPDRIVTSSSRQDRKALAGLPLTDLQHSFVCLSRLMASEESQHLDSTAIRTMLRNTVLEGAEK